MIPFGSSLSQQDASAVAITLTEFEAAAAAQLADAFAGMSPWNQYPFTPDTLAKYFTANEPGAPRYALRCADGTNTVIGALGLRENWLRGPYIQFLGLTETFQCRGIGEALLGNIEASARANGAQNIWVMASEFNDRAQNFYCRFGFSPAAHIDALVSADKTEVLLRKRLG